MKTQFKYTMFPARLRHELNKYTSQNAVSGGYKIIIFIDRVIIK